MAKVTYIYKQDCEIHISMKHTVSRMKASTSQNVGENRACPQIASVIISDMGTVLECYFKDRKEIILNIKSFVFLWVEKKNTPHPLSWALFRRELVRLMQFIIIYTICFNLKFWLFWFDLLLLFHRKHKYFTPKAC